MSGEAERAPPLPDKSAIIDALERFVDHPGTLPLFDVLSERDSPDLPARVLAIYQRFPGHPLAVEVRRWIEASGVAIPAVDLGAVLGELGIDDVRAWAERQKKERTALERALEEAREGQVRASLAANGYSLVCVLLFCVALIGWAAAFHIWDFVPEVAVPGPGSSKPAPAAIPDTPIKP